MKTRVVVIAAAVALAVFTLVPRVMYADDCGMMGWLFGCDAESQATQEANRHAEVQGAQDVQAQGIQSQENVALTEIDKRATIDQAEINAYAQTEQYKADAAASMERWRQATEQQRIAADERVAQAQIGAQERSNNTAVAAQERMNTVNATTSLNIVAAQGQTLQSLAQVTAAAEQRNQTSNGLMLLVVLAVVVGGGYAARQWRSGKEAEVKAAALAARKAAVTPVEEAVIAKATRNGQRFELVPEGVSVYDESIRDWVLVRE